MMQGKFRGKCFWGSVFCLILFALPAISGTVGSTAPQEPRQWTVGKIGILFEMTKDDLRAWKDTKNGAPVFSAQALLSIHKKEFDRDAEERARELLQAEPPEYPTMIDDQSCDVQPLSVVGPIVSYLETTDGFSPGAAHPYHSQTIEAKDVSGSKTKVSLLDFYSEKQIVDALKADPWIQKFKAPQDSFASADTLAKLADLLNDAESNIQLDSCEMDAYFEADLVNHFAFYDLTPNAVAVRIGVPYSTEVCRGTFHQVGLALPIPEKLREYLGDAQQLKAGFLMKSRKSVGAPTYSASWEVDIQELAKKLRKNP